MFEKDIYCERTSCAFCDSPRLTPFLDLGNVALAGNFLEKRELGLERSFPLRIAYCSDCHGVQLIDLVQPEYLFSNYFYGSSSIQTLQNHFEDYADFLARKFPQYSSALEIGCNDGVLLKPLSRQHFSKIIGVDPASNLLPFDCNEKISLYNSCFNEEASAKILHDHGHIDLVIANNVFAHIPDLQGATIAIKNILSPQGIFVFEVHHISSLINGFQYDMIYHEHIYYHSVNSLSKFFARFGLFLYDVEEIGTHGGSIRCFVRHASGVNNLVSSDRMTNLLFRELKEGYCCIDTYFKFAKNVKYSRTQLLSILSSMIDKNIKIIGYGASGRANTILQYCGIDLQYLNYIVDDSPLKQGYYTPTSHLLIRSSDAIYLDRPDIVLLFAWTFAQEIRSKHAKYQNLGGQFLIPLPKPTLV